MSQTRRWSKAFLGAIEVLIWIKLIFFSITLEEPGFVFYGVLYGLAFRIMGKGGLYHRDLYGSKSSRSHWRMGLVLGVPALAGAAGLTYLNMFGLSFLFPTFVMEIFLEPELESGVPAFLIYVVIGPFVEELLRAILLLVAARYWGMTKSLVLVSLLFGLGHLDLFGSTVFAFILSLYFLRTQSLWLSTVLHGLHNLVVVVAVQFETKEITLEAFQSDIWLYVLLAVVGIPFIVAIIRGGIPTDLSKWLTPR